MKNKERVEALESKRSQQNQTVIIFFDDETTYKGIKYNSEKKLLKDNPMLEDALFLKIDFV